ncbi:hypothetical protein CapIbe_016126 [Capra ibex]
MSVERRPPAWLARRDSPLEGPVRSGPSGRERRTSGWRRAQFRECGSNGTATVESAERPYLDQGRGSG